MMKLMKLIQVVIQQNKKRGIYSSLFKFLDTFFEAVSRAQKSISQLFL